MYGYNAEPPIAIPITQYGSTASKRVNEEVILHYISSKKTSSHAKFQAQSLQNLSVLT